MRCGTRIFFTEREVSSGAEIGDNEYFRMQAAEVEPFTPCVAAGMTTAASLV